MTRSKSRKAPLGKYILMMRNRLPARSKLLFLNYESVLTIKRKLEIWAHRKTVNYSRQMSQVTGRKHGNTEVLGLWKKVWVPTVAEVETGQIANT